MTTSERVGVIACGLRHITELMGEEAFCGQGSAGTKHCKTHDCDAEEHATLIHQAPSLVLSTA